MSDDEEEATAPALAPTEPPHAPPAEAKDGERPAEEAPAERRARKRSRWSATEADRSGAGTSAVASSSGTSAVASAADNFLSSVNLQQVSAHSGEVTGIADRQVHSQHQATQKLQQLMSLSNVPNISGLVANKAQTPVDMEERDRRRLFVGNLPPMLRAPELQAVFAPLGALGAEIPVVGKTFGFVQFNSEVQAVQALAHMNGFELGGRKLRVSRPHNSRVIQQQNIEAMHVAQNQAAAIAAQVIAGVGGPCHMPMLHAAPPIAPQQLQMGLPPQLYAAALGGSHPNAAAVAAAAAAMSAISGRGAVPPALNPMAALIGGAQPVVQPVVQPVGAPLNPTRRVLLLSNLVAYNELDDDLKDEVRSECSRSAAAPAKD